MSRRRVIAIVTFTLLGPVGAGILAHHSGSGHSQSIPDTAVSAPTQIFITSPSVAAVARAFTTDIDTASPAQPLTVSQLDGVATPALARQLISHPVILTPAETGGRQHLTVDAVTVHRGPPVAAMVLATLAFTGTRASEPQALLASTLTLVDTDTGWRVSKATS